MSFKRLIFTFGTLALALAASPLAQAQTCQTTANCHKGFVCVMSTAKPEPATPPPATAPSGPTIDPTGPAKTSALVAPQTGYCQAAECASDSECGPNMVCHSETIQACSGGTAPACKPNTDCGGPAIVAPPTCTEMKSSHCAFTWQLPCSTDTECGAGFMCTPTTSGSCSGSSGGGTGGAAGGPTPTAGGTAPSTGTGTPSSGAAAPADLVAPVPPDRNCTTTTSFPGFCQPKATTCASSTDCPTDFTCTATPGPNTGSPVSTRPASTGAAGTAGTTTGGATSADAFVPPAAGVPVPTTMTCTSPYYGYGARTAEDSTGGSPTGGGTTGGPPSQNAGGAGTGGAIPPMSPTPTHETAGTGTSMPTNGCAVGGGSSSLALAAFALLGLVIARRRR